MSRGNKMAPVPHPASKQCQSPTRRRQTTLSHVCVNTHTQTYTQTYAHHMWNLLSDCLSGSPAALCLSWDLFDFCESLAATDWRQAARVPSAVSRVLCVCPGYAFVALLLPSSCPASPFPVFILLSFPCMFFSHLWLKHVNAQRAICLKCAQWFMPSPSQKAGMWYIYLLPSFGKQNPC